MRKFSEIQRLMAPPRKLKYHTPKYMELFQDLDLNAQIYAIGEYLRHRELFAADRVASTFKYGPMIDSETKELVSTDLKNGKVRIHHTLAWRFKTQ